MSTALAAHLVSSPGEILDEWLEERHMTQREFAERVGKSEKFVSQLINGKASLTPDTAHALALVSKVSANTWLRMEADYRAVLKQESAMAKESPFEATLIRALRNIGVVTAPPGARGQQAQEVFQLVGVASHAALENLARRRAAAFRTSAAFTPDPVATEVMLALILQHAGLIETKRYSVANLMEALPELRALTQDEPAQGARRARELLSEVGVALVFIPSLPKTHCIGVTLWDRDRAIVGLTDRGKREDIFWFTLFHELAHVLEGDRDAIYLDSNHAGDRSDAERLADTFASETLLPPAAEDDLHSIRSFSDLEQISHKLGVGPAILVGQLHHRGLKPHSWGTQFLRKVVIEAA